MRPRRRAQRRAGATRSAQTQYEPALLRGPAPRDLERRETRIRSVSSDSIVLRVAAAGWLVLVLGGGAASAKEAGGTPVAFAAAENASQLIALDLTTKRVVGRI